MRNFIFGLVLVVLASPVWAARPHVTVRQGELVGVREGDITVFRGIPFAGDTGGRHRWRPPTPPPYWEGVRDASQFGPVCPQPRTHDGKPQKWLKHFTMSEDCLNLSVYTPSLTPTHALPVMVWIHGGGNRFGSGSFYDGSRLASHGVVVVTLNYRLGLLGRFAYPGLNAAYPNGPRGNYYLMDVLAGLRWVHDNINRFGGDPGNVTVFGQSAGSMIVTALLASPASKGLFQRAIAESGVAMAPAHPLYLARSLPRSPSLEKAGVKTAHGLLPGDKQVAPDALRDLSWQAILKYQVANLPKNAMQPASSTKLLPEPVGKRFAEHKQLSVPLLIGTVSWEKSLFVHFHFPPEQILGTIPEAKLHALYPGLTPDQTLDQWLADRFHAAARWLANSNASVGQPTWVYQFDHLSSAAIKAGQPGAAHGDELPYLFDVRGRPQPDLECAGEKRMSELMLGYWTRFVRTGNPNGSGLPEWPRWKPGGQGVTELLNVPVRHQQGLMKNRMTYQLERFARMLKVDSEH